MKELWSKTFWRDVKRTFDEARADTIPAAENSQKGFPVEAKADDAPAHVSSPAETIEASERSVD